MTEILKNLRCVQGQHKNDVLGCGELRISDMARDAADTIERLESEDAALREQLAEKDVTLKRVTAERECAVKDLEEEDSCRTCEHAVDGESCLCEDCVEGGEDADCEKCPWFGDPCGECNSMNSRWQWRGLQKEDNESDSPGV